MPETEITAYSTTDLLHIMGLTDPTIEEVKASAAALIARMKAAQKPHMAIFFQQAEEKIIREISAGDQSEDEQDDPTTQMGNWWANEYLAQRDPQQADKTTERKQKVSIFDGEHATLKRERLGIADTFSVPVAQGTMNPTLRNVTTRTVLIDSQFRQNIDARGANLVEEDAGSKASKVYNSTDFTVDLSESLKNVLSMQLYQVQIPVTWYAFSCAFGNVTYTINDQKCTRTISEGNYSLEDILGGKMVGRAFSDEVAYPTAIGGQASAAIGNKMRDALIPCRPQEAGTGLSGSALEMLNTNCVGSQYCAKTAPSTGTCGLGASPHVLDPSGLDPSGNCANTPCYQSNLHVLCFELGGVNNNRLVNPGPDTYYFFKPRTGISDAGVCGACPPNPFINQNLGWSLGFRPDKTGSIRADPGVPAAAAPDLFGPKYFVVALDDYNNNRLNQGIISTVNASVITQLPSYAGSIFWSQKKVDNGTNPTPGQPRKVCRYGAQDPRQYTEKQIYVMNEILRTREPGGINAGLQALRAQGPTTGDMLGLVPLDGIEITSLRTAGLLNPATAQLGTGAGSGGDLSFFARSTLLGGGAPYTKFGAALDARKREYFGPVNIERVRVRLLDDKGTPVDLNGLDWAISITVESLYQY